MDWIHLAQDRRRFMSVMNTAMNTRVGMDWIDLAQDWNS
jgi:hypothetical protein